METSSGAVYNEVFFYSQKFRLGLIENYVRSGVTILSKLIILIGISEVLTLHDIINSSK